MSIWRCRGYSFSVRRRITRNILITLVCLILFAPQQQAQAGDLQISCAGGGSYTLILPAGVVINGKTCTGTLVVDSRAKVIGKDAFSFSKVTSVQLPNSVVTIEASAFSYNTFTSIALGNSVESFGFEAFRMSKFSSISLPNSLKVIGECAFCDTYFSAIKLPESLISIGRNAFTRDEISVPLVSIEIPDSVKEIGVYAFANAKLETVKIGKSLREIPFSAFRYNRLKSVTIPPNVTFIGASSFRDNPLESLSLSDGLRGMDTEAVYGTKFVYLSIPDSVTGIGGKAFANIPTLKTVTLSENFEQFRNIDNALWVGDVFEGSYGISEINYCGKMIGFLIQPVCTGAKKSAIDAKAKAAAELKAKQEAELKAKQEAEAKAIADAAAQKVIQDDFNAVTSSYQKLLLRIYDLKIKFPRVSNLLGIEEKMLRLPIILGSDLSTAKYNIQSVNASLDASEKVWEKTQKTTITCVKGKTTKKVTAIKPKCPSGYKVKK